MAITSTPGDAESNSYVSVSEADTYFSMSYGQNAWGTLDLSVKETLLVQSTRLLDSVYLWSGLIDSSSTQALRWPRIGVYDMDRRAISSSIVPNQIKNATCEMAIYIYSNGGYNPDENVLDSMKVGPISMSFSDVVKAPNIPKIVQDIIQDLGTLNSVSGNGIRQVRLVR